MGMPGMRREQGHVLARVAHPAALRRLDLLEPAGQRLAIVHDTAAGTLTAVLRAGFYPRTPRWAMLIVSVVVFGIVAYRGVVSVARFFEVIGTVFVITAVAVHFVMLLQGDPREVLPRGDCPARRMTATAHFTFPYSIAMQEYWYFAIDRDKRLIPVAGPLAVANAYRLSHSSPSTP